MGSSADVNASKAWWDTSSWDEFEKRFKNREQMEAELRAKYFTNMHGKYDHRRLRGQVLAAEKSCEHLDRLKSIEESELWPPQFREHFPNKAEMQVAPFEGAKTPWDELLLRNELHDPQHCANRLVDLLTHLRTVHLYCLYCGCHFDDADDLERSCPGFDEDVHQNADNMAKRTAPLGVTRELAPPPKRARPTAPPAVVDDEDDEAFTALFDARPGVKPAAKAGGVRPKGFGFIL